MSEAFLNSGSTQQLGDLWNSIVSYLASFLMLEKWSEQNLCPSFCDSCFWLCTTCSEKKYW